MNTFGFFKEHASMVNNNHDQNYESIFSSYFVILSSAAALLYCVSHFLRCNRGEHTFIDLDEDEENAFIPNQIQRRHSL